MPFSPGTLLRAVSWLVRELRHHRFRKLWTALRASGPVGCWRRARIKFGKTPVTPLTKKETAKLLATCASNPLISLVVPVFHVERCWLRRCIRSVRAQYYSNWELVLVDDGTGDPKLRRFLKRWCQRDSRIHARILEKHEGIAGATNAGIAMARGRFVGFLDHDDTLTRDALAWIVAAHNRRPQAEWFYSDEDKISRWGCCHGAHFKPDFSPELLFTNMFTCHLSVYGTSLVRRAGGLRGAFDGAQDHDLALRIAELVPACHVVHVPRVLYHWRSLPGSSAVASDEKPDAVEAGHRAVAEALARRGVPGEVAPHPNSRGIHRLHLAPKGQPHVALLVTPGGTAQHRMACVESARALTKHSPFDVIDLQQTTELTILPDTTQARRRIRVDPKEVSPADLRPIYQAAEQTDAEFLVLLDGRVRVASEAWLEQLLAVAQLDPHVAGVGTLLSYPNGRVYHAGMILGVGGCGGYAHRGMRKTDPGYFGRLQCLQEFSAVSTRFVLLRREAFLAAGGFGPDLTNRTCADVDLWIRLRSRGWRCLYHPMVEGVYTPSRERGNARSGAEAAAEVCQCTRAWETVADPFYNPNLTRENEPFLGFREVSLDSILDPPRPAAA